MNPGEQAATASPPRLTSTLSPGRHVLEPASVLGLASSDARPRHSVFGRTATRPRVALMAILLAAAMPVRIPVSAPIVGSVSVLDIVLIGAAGTLLLDATFRPLDTGYRQLFWLLCIPFIASAASIVWSQDRSATLHATIVSAEALVAYLVVVRELAGVPASRVIAYIRRYAYLLVIPAVLLLLNVPGFEPQIAGVKESSGDYISYYTRLSHPFLGRSNNLATVLAFVAPLLVYWGHVRRNRWAIVAGIVAFIAIFLTQSRSALLAFLVAGVVFAPFALGRPGARTRLMRTILAVILLGAVAVAALYSLNPATNEFFSGRFSRANIDDRSALLQAGTAKIADRPLLGYGAGVTPEEDPVLAGGVHNTFVQQVMYFGLPLGLLVVAAIVGFAGFFVARRLENPLGGAVAYVVLVQIVIFLFQASFEGTLLRVLFYLSVGLGVALLRAVERESLPDAAR
jgi:O-antigen ligase